MWKSIYKQLWNRKKNNGWLLLDLLLVFCLVWYVVDYFFVLGYNYTLPNHRDLNNTYDVSVVQFSENHIQFDEAENTPEAIFSNYHRILERIRQHPGVDQYGVSLYNSIPGIGGWNGITLMNPDNKDISVSSQRILLAPDGDYLRVFNYSADQGDKQVSGQDYNWDEPHSILICASTARALFGEESPLGRHVVNPWDGDKQYKVVGILDEIKRFDHKRFQHSVWLTQRLTPEVIPYAKISIRTRAGLNQREFLESFKETMLRELRIGNFYFLQVKPYKEIQIHTQRRLGLFGEIRSRGYIMLFFLLNILLCVMGNFWYRISIRKEEMGVRMALGSSRSGIRKVLYVEGIALLLLIFVPALLIEYQFVQADLINHFSERVSPEMGYLTDRKYLRFLITNLITLGIMIAVVLVAVYLPARKASRLHPAEALHFE